MSADEEFCPPAKGVAAFHLFAPTEAAGRQLEPLIGRKVAVAAMALFCA